MKPLIIIDKQQITRLGMQSLAHEMHLFERIILAENKSQLLHHLTEYPQAVVVIDYTKVDLNPDRLLILKERFEDVRWIIFCDLISNDVVRRLTLRGHQFSILLKEALLTEIQHVLRVVAAGGRVISEQATALQNSSQTGSVKLTNTEEAILRSLAMGKKTKEIAEERFSSVYTIMTHRRNIFSKLNVNNMHEATRYALRAGIVDTAEYFI